MPKFSPERAKELMTKAKTMRPKINGKVIYERIPIARRHSLALRHENRLYIGSVVAGKVVELYECHPDTIPEKIIPNGRVRELTFGEMWPIAALEPVCGSEIVVEEGGEV